MLIATTAHHLIGFPRVILLSFGSAAATITMSLVALPYRMKHQRRDAQLRLMQQVDGLFNARSMRDYRKRAAGEMLEMRLSRLLCKPTEPIRHVIDFFAGVARDCHSGQLSIDDVERAYQVHIHILWASYHRFLKDPSRNKKYADLQWLVNQWCVQDELAAGVSFVQKAFLETEVNL